MSRQKTRDAILVVAIFGLWLLMPPSLAVFDRPVGIAGIPLIVVYVFGVWLGLIVVTMALSRRIGREIRRDRPPPADDVSGGEAP